MNILGPACRRQLCIRKRMQLLPYVPLRCWDVPSPLPDSRWKQGLSLIHICSLEDIKEFRNLTSLTVQVRTLTDLSPLASMEKLTYLNLLVSPKLSSLDWLQGMPQLEELMMWGESYPEIRDIKVFEGMDSLTSVMIILPSVKDISVFAGLPNLETLWINCHKNVDITPVKEAGQIKSLMVNTEEIR